MEVLRTYSSLVVFPLEESVILREILVKFFGTIGSENCSSNFCSAL